MGTKLTELRDGCFHKAMDNEPMFVLLARDASAPDMVEAWASKRRDEIEAGKRPASDMAQVEEAFATAERMRLWRIDNDGAWRTGLFADSPVLVTTINVTGVISKEQAQRIASQTQLMALRPAYCRNRLIDEHKPVKITDICQHCLGDHRRNCPFDRELQR